MNKNDFYKELMTQYALDPEKIRMNALKQAKKPTWQRVVGDYWRPAMGAAAAVAVTVAGVTYANRSSAPDITVEPDEVLSASQRLIEAEQNYYNNSGEETFSDIYVTFIEPVSYNEIIMALSTVADAGEFELCSIYTDMDRYEDEEIIDFVANRSNEEAAIAAKLSLPSSFYRDIQDLSIVYLAELGSAEINDDTFVPIPVEDEDPLGNDLMNIVTTTENPVVTTTPFSFESSETTPKQLPVIGESADSNTITTRPPVTGNGNEAEESVETEESAETTDVSETEDIAETTEITEVEDPVDAETPNEEETSAVTTDAPETSPEETTTTYYRGEVGLMTEIYELNVKNSLETHIAGNNAVVLTKSEAYLYTFGGFAAHQNSEIISVSNPKLALKNDSFIILTGCREDGVRSMLSVVNLANDTVYTYDASANIGECEIGSIQYSMNSGKYFMKAVSANSTLVYELTIDGAVYFRPLAEIDGPVSLAGYKNDLLYLATADKNMSTRLYSFNCVDGTSVEIAAFPSTAKIKRSADFESFAVIPSDGSTSFILDANLGMLVATAVDENVALITNGGETFFRLNGAYYKIDSTSTVIAADRAVDFEIVTNETFVVNEINSEKVVVIRDGGDTWR